MAEFRMPSLGADMVEGTLVEWYVKPGDRVKRGDIIAVVETSKADIEIEVFEDGIIEEILIQEGQKVPVGTVLAMIRPEEAEEAPLTERKISAEIPEKPAPPQVAPLAEKEAEKRPAAVKVAIPPAAKRPKVSPLARKMAAELGIDLSAVQGSGPDNIIQRADVEKAAAAQKRAEAERAAKPAVAPAAEIKPPAADFQEKIRQAIAAAMSRSNREIPHYYLETRIDMTNALKRLELENSKRSIKDRLLPAVLLIKATALALEEVPELNAYWVDDRLEPQEAIHIGFAIALRQGGLIAPAIHHADLKSLDELMTSLRDLITRTRAGRLRSSEMTDATIMITSLGDLGVEKVYGVIYPPQVALVGFGKIMDQPWAENGMLGIRPVITVTLAGDHRATDGLRGARFLNALSRYLQEAEKL